MQNPYGAVPEALKDTRISLRDIMADMFMNKKLEGDLSLAKSKAETETALVNSGIERDKLINLKDITRMTEDSRHNLSTEGTAQQHAATEELVGKARMTEDSRHNLSTEGTAQQHATTEALIGKAHAGLFNVQAAAASRQAKADNEIISAGDYAKRRGAGHMVEMLGIDPNMKLPSYKWEGLGRNIEGLLKTSPAMQVTATGYEIKSQLEDLSKKYNTPGLDPAAKAGIKKDMETKLGQFQKLNQFIMTIKEPDPVKVATEARKTWEENPQVRTQFTNYDDFHQNFADSIKQTRTAFHDNIRNIKTRMATLDIDPDYMGAMQTAQQTISSLADQKLAGEIGLGTKNRLKKGDLKGAYEYTTNWARSLEAKKNPAASIPAVTAPDQTTTALAPAEEEIPSAGGQRLRDVAAAISSGAGAVWDKTGGALGRNMQARATEQIAAYIAEITALKAAGNLTPQTQEAAQRKYPYARIQ